MNRSELIRLLAERFPALFQRDAEMVITEIIGTIHATLVGSDRVKIPGFGSFWLNYRALTVDATQKDTATYQ